MPIKPPPKPPPCLAARRDIQTKKPISSSAGPKPNKSVRKPLPDCRDSARISTPLAISSDSSPGSMNAGTVVSKAFDLRGVPRLGSPLAAGGGQLTSFANMPSIASPRA
jgi:hypothetical protein